MSTRLRPVPDAPPRAVAYIRVSREKDDGISPELQLSAIEEHCARAGYVLVETISDLDQTGRFWKRRQVERAVTMIESGDADVVVVWKWSRVARNRLDFAIAVDRVESAGGKLDSATEPMDASTSTGRFARGMLAEFAAFESDRIGDVWREVHARRTAKGLPSTGKSRFGYELVDGIHRPHPKHGPVLAEMYRRYVAGDSVISVAAWLNREGVPTNAGYNGMPSGLWSHQVVRRMLDRGFAAGFITVNGEQRRGAHEPVIDDKLWRAYLSARESRRVLRRSEASPYPLSGLVRCSCGAPMTATGQTPPYMRCTREVPGGPRHPGRYAKLATIETAVLDWLRDLASDEAKAVDAKVAQRARLARVRQDVRGLRRELVKLDQALTRLQVDRAKDPTIPASVYAAARDELLLEREQVQSRLTITEGERAGAPPARLAGDLVENWDIWPVAQRRAQLRLAVKYVVVSRAGRSVSVEVVPAWSEG